MATSQVRLTLDIQRTTFKPSVSGDATSPSPLLLTHQPENSGAVSVFQRSVNIATQHLADAVGWFG